jgi:hypothetical protein
VDLAITARGRLAAVVARGQGGGVHAERYGRRRRPCNADAVNSSVSYFFSPIAKSKTRLHAYRNVVSEGRTSLFELQSVFFEGFSRSASPFFAVPFMKYCTRWLQTIVVVGEKASVQNISIRVISMTVNCQSITLFS